LHEKGIYVENYELGGKSYKMTVYSAQSTVNLKNDKVRMKGYAELTNQTHVKAGYTNKYGIIVLYDDNKKFQMLLQISGSESPDKVTRQWLNYLAIVVASEEQKGSAKDGISKLLTAKELVELWEGMEDIVLDSNGGWWVSQFNEAFKIPCGCWPDSCNGKKIASNQCCNRATNMILFNAGTSTNNAHKIVIAESGNSDCGELTGIATEFENALEIIDKSLKEHELPIMVGVHHPYSKKNKDNAIIGWIDKCSSNTPNITNHYVVIRGKKYDIVKKQYYYLFYEVGTSQSMNGTSSENRLYINDNLIEGNSSHVTNYPGNYYTVTEVRKNEDQTY
jgi:hypothetical protein